MADRKKTEGMESKPRKFIADLDYVSAAAAVAETALKADELSEEDAEKGKLLRSYGESSIVLGSALTFLALFEMGVIDESFDASTFHSTLAEIQQTQVQALTEVNNGASN